MLEKRAEGEDRLKTNMISHLSTLNDGVIAIFITVMMLEIPFPTKWILHQNDRYTAVHFGAVYILTTLFQRFLYFAALRKRFRDTPGLFLLMVFSKTGLLLALSALLMLLSWFYPHQVIILYIILPVISFFMP